MRSLAALLLVLLAAGCGSSPPEDERAEPSAAKGPPRCTPSVEIEGGEACELGDRAYTRVRPAGAARDASTVVIVLHGVGGPAASGVAVAGISRMHEGADFVTVYPEADGGEWLDSDVLFFRDLLRREGARRAVIIGWSGSGFVAHQAGCEDAVQVVAVLHAPLLSSCTPETPVSVLQLAGTADRFIPFGGGETPDGRDAPPMRRAMRTWRRALGCGAVERTRDGRVTSERASCRAGARVELRAIRGAGHEWYGPAAQPPDDAVDATSLIRAFIARR